MAGGQAGVVQTVVDVPDPVDVRLVRDPDPGRPDGEILRVDVDLPVEGGRGDQRLGMEAQAVGLPAFDHQAVHQVIVIERMAVGGDRGGQVEVEQGQGVLVQIGLEQVLPGKLGQEVVRVHAGDPVGLDDLFVHRQGSVVVEGRLGFGQQDGIVFGAGDGRGVLARLDRGQGFLEQREVDKPVGVGGVQFRAGIERHGPGRIAERIVPVPLLIQFLQEPPDAFVVGLDDRSRQFGRILLEHEVHFLEGSGRNLFRGGMIADQAGLQFHEGLVPRLEVVPSLQVRGDAGRGARKIDADEGDRSPVRRIRDQAAHLRDLRASEQGQEDAKVG